MTAPVLTADHIRRLLEDLIRAELNRLNPNRLVSPALPGDVPFENLDWGIDSLQFVELAASVNEMFHLYQTGLEENLLRRRTLAQWVDIVARCWQAHPHKLTFRTSGSSGHPKRCPHDMALLIQEAHKLAALFPARNRVIGMVPSHHIYGFLFTVLLPQILAVPFVDGRSLGIGQLSDLLAPGDLIISFPLNWAYLERSLPAFPDDVSGTNSTGPIHAELIRALQKKGLRHVTEVYGSTETAGIGYRHDPDDFYTLFDFWQRTQLADVNEYGLIRRRPDGTLVDPIVPMDVLVWESERHFRPQKRLDGAIQVGGVNVFPQHVAERIQAHPGVKACAVRPDESTEITRLKAFIVAQDDLDIETFRPEIENWIFENFTAAERPARITFGRDLPRNAMGKLEDW